MLTFSLASSSFAQVGFGVKGGMNFAKIGGSDVIVDVKTRTGFAAGAYLEMSLPALITIQPEVLYSTKGVIFETNYTRLGQPATSTQTNTYTYLEVPVLVKYSFPIPVFKPTLYVGPEVGFLLNARARFEDTGASTVESDIKSIITGTDLGAVFGASVHVLAVDIEVRYTMGLKSTTKGYSANVYNRVWGIMAGIPLL